MNFLEEKILSDAIIKPGDILKIDNFLNHQIDIGIIRQIAIELKRRFEGIEVNKILTIEASGIAIATMLGNLYDVPVVFAKKSETANSTDNKYVSQAYSFTHKQMNKVFSTTVETAEQISQTMLMLMALMELLQLNSRNLRLWLWLLLDWHCVRIEVMLLSSKLSRADTPKGGAR